MVSAAKNPSSMIMATKVPEPGEPATGQDIKSILLLHPVEYPHINEKICVRCGMCLRVCPIKEAKK